MTRTKRDDQAGYTLVEAVVSMVLLFVVLAIVTSVIASTQRASDAVRRNTTLGEEARGTLNRIGRELRQAKRISAVDGLDGAKGLTFDVDFNGNGVIDPSVSDPESLTYFYDGVRLLLSAADDTGLVTTRPVLNGVVDSFSLSYRSSDYRFDCNGDGITTWQELDGGSCRPAGTSVGNANGKLDAAELDHIDSVVLAFTVQEAGKRQAYRTQIDLRNAT